MKTEIEITPAVIDGSYLQHTISGLTALQVSEKIGFPPNQKDDPAKVVHSWGFKANGSACAVWDWKGSQHFNQFSAFGSRETLCAVFGAEHVI